MVVRELFARLGLDVDAQSFAAGEQRINAVATMLGSMVKLAAVAAGGVAFFAQQVAKAGADAQDASNRLGISTAAVQELGYAAKLTGTTFESLAQGFAFMARKGVKDLDKGLADLADKVAALPPGGARAQAALEALGRGAVDLVPLLALGSEGIAELRKEARSMGLVLDGEAIAAADAFDDALDRIGERLKGLRNRVIGPWLPTLLKWLKSLEVALIGVSDAMASVAKWADVLIVLFGSAMGASLLILVSQLAVAAGGFGALAAAAIAAAAATIAAWAAAAAPFLALTAIIFSLYLIVEDLWTTFQGGEGIIVPALKRLGAAIADAFATAITWWKQLFTDFFGWVGDKVTGLGRWMGEQLMRPVEALRQMFGAEPKPDGVPTIGPDGATSALDPSLRFGAGASPTSSASSSPVVAVASPRFNASFVVNGAPGQDPEAIAGAVRDTLDQWQATQLRQAYAAVGGA